MEREAFKALVAKAIENLPLEISCRVENVDVVIEDWPTLRQLAKVKLRSRLSLFGLYEGVPQTGRGGAYNMVLPDKITIFRKPIEARWQSENQIEQEIRRVIRHEIAHHFGIGDGRLRAIEKEPHRKQRQ